ncbi:hypothetical protein HYY72_03925 [Candidatus Woesearchaeota archaeon]|nr:hypothetical protein [Candidatus Woesearchaeota archaeon]
MALRKPESVEECIYFTQRSLGDQQQGYAMAWVFRQKCEKCKNALMGKPKDKKTGKVLIRAKEYACESCGNTVEKKEYEEGLAACVEYTCPACRNQGEKEIPFKRRKIEGIDTLRFQCDKCKAGIDITKKMKVRKSNDYI